MAYVFLLNKNLRIIRIKLFQTYKNYDIFHIIDQIKGSKVLLWIYVKLCNGLTLTEKSIRNSSILIKR